MGDMVDIDSELVIAETSVCVLCKELGSANSAPGLLGKSGVQCSSSGERARSPSLVESLREKKVDTGDLSRGSASVSIDTEEILWCNCHD